MNKVKDYLARKFSCEDYMKSEVVTTNMTLPSTFSEETNRCSRVVAQVRNYGKKTKKLGVGGSPAVITLRPPTQGTPLL